MKRPIARDRMEAFARALKHARQTHSQASVLETLHAHFQAIDADGLRWTVGLHDLRWHRQDGSRWIPAEPPAGLQMDEATRLAFDVLAEMVRPPEPATPRDAERVPVSRAQMEHFAQRLNAARAAQTVSPELFKALHARFQAADESGTAWTVGLAHLRWHRRDEKKWIAAAPPDAVFLDADLHEALAALPEPESEPEQRPTPPPDHCTRCGAVLRKGQKFCSACGQPAHVQSSAPEHADRGAREQAPVSESPRKCPSCGHAVPAAKKFCTACGTPMAETSSP